MEAGTGKTSSRLCPQDSRFRFYGGTIYGSVHWVPVDPGANPHHPEEEEEEARLETAVDHLSRLPDHVIVHHLFDKMPDLKTLFNFSLVSKHFSSLVFDAQSVSVKVANWLPVCSCHPDPAARPPTFLSRARWHLLNLLRKPFKSACPLLLARHDRDNFLKKFSCIRSLDIDLSYTSSSPASDHRPLLRWRFDKYGFILVSAKNREVGFDGEDTSDVVVDDEQTSAELWRSIECHLLDAVYRLSFGVSLVGDVSHLKSVLLRDCLGQGRVEVDEELVGEIESANDTHESEPWCVKVWHLQAVKLPKMGCVMKDVTICVVKVDEVEDGLLVENAFGEDGEYGELARRVIEEKITSSGKLVIYI